MVVPERTQASGTEGARRPRRPQQRQQVRHAVVTPGQRRLLHLARATDAHVAWQRGGVRVAPSDGELEPAVRASLDRLRPALESQGAEVDLVVERPLPAARFDLVLVGGVLMRPYLQRQIAETSAGLLNVRFSTLGELGLRL